MAVYTKINKKDISYINKKFEVEKIINFKGIKKGIENTNYLLRSKNKKFILTIFEKRVFKKEIPFFMKLMDQLNNAKINCPKPLKNKSGNYLIRIKNKTACIVSYLKGKDRQNLSLKNCYEIGRNIGKLHTSSKKIKLYRKNSMSINNLNLLLKNTKSKKIPSELRTLLKKKICKRLKKIGLKIYPKELFMVIYLLIIFFLIKKNLQDLLIFIFLVTII